VGTTDSFRGTFDTTDTAEASAEQAHLRNLAPERQCERKLLIDKWLRLACQSLRHSPPMRTVAHDRRLPGSTAGHSETSGQLLIRCMLSPTRSVSEESNTVFLAYASGWWWSRFRLGWMDFRRLLPKLTSQSENNHQKHPERALPKYPGFRYYMGLRAFDHTLVGIGLTGRSRTNQYPPDIPDHASDPPI